LLEASALNIPQTKALAASSEIVRKSSRNSFWFGSLLWRNIQW